MRGNLPQDSKVKCFVCGGSYTASNRSHHLRTKKHNRGLIKQSDDYRVLDLIESKVGGIKAIIKKVKAMKKRLLDGETIDDSEFSALGKSLHKDYGIHPSEFA
jgi:hypothetical protein